MPSPAQILILALHLSRVGVFCVDVNVWFADVCSLSLSLDSWLELLISCAFDPVFWHLSSTSFLKLTKSVCLLLSVDHLEIDKNKTGVIEGTWKWCNLCIKILGLFIILIEKAKKHKLPSQALSATVITEINRYWRTILEGCTSMTDSYIILHTNHQS